MADPALRDAIAKGADLKHADTTDKSGPHIEEDVHVKKVDRQGFLTEVEGGASLKHADTVDKSAPHTDGAAVKPNQHGAVFAEIKSKQ